MLTQAPLVVDDRCLLLAGLLLGLNQSRLLAGALVEGAHLLQQGGGIAQLLTTALALLLSPLQQLGLLFDGGLQLGQALLFNSQRGPVLLLLFTGGGEGGVMAVQSSGL